LNAVEMARRQFREIARVAGLAFPGFPWQRKTGRQLQVSSGLIFDVLRNHDKNNLLLRQADREVLERQLDVSRLKTVMESLDERRIVFVNIPRFTPLGFPLWAAWMQQQVSSESWTDRVRRAAALLEEASQEKVPA
jgi:ATP-dependent Lhr-like helicase